MKHLNNMHKREEIFDKLNIEEFKKDKDLGRDYKKWRRKLGLSIKMLSQLSSVSKTTIYRLEKIDKEPSRKTLVKIWDALEKVIDVLDVEKLNKETGKDYKRRREKLGLSIKMLSQRSGVSKSTIYKLEKTGIEPSRKTLVKIWDVLGFHYSKRKNTLPHRALELGKCIKKKRKENMLSVEMLSKQSGISKTTIYKIENRYKIPSDITVGKLSKALNTDEIDLLILKYKALVPSEFHYIFSVHELKKRKKWLQDLTIKSCKLGVADQVFKALEMLIRKGRIRFKRKIKE